MFKLLCFMFLTKTLVIFALAQQIKSFNAQFGIVQKSDLFNEIILATIFPGIFGLLAAVMLLAWSVALLMENFFLKTNHTRG